jgi:hypothetical protein
MSSQISQSQTSQNVQLNKKSLAEEMLNYEKEIMELMMKMKLLEQPTSKENKKVEKIKKYKLFVEINKEQINANKTQKQLEAEQNTLLFKGFNTREKVFDNKDFIRALPEKRDGKVKYLNQLINVNEYNRNADIETNKEKIGTEISINTQDKIPSNETKNKEQIVLALNKKKLNEIKTYARDLKITGYSTMNKENLINRISEFLLKRSEKISKKENIENKNENDKKTIQEKCGIDNSIVYDEDDLNGNNENNEFFDDDNDDDNNKDIVEYDNSKDKNTRNITKELDNYNKKQEKKVVEEDENGAIKKKKIDLLRTL